jgi:hypothetical protein
VAFNSVRTNSKCRPRLLGIVVAAGLGLSAGTAHADRDWDHGDHRSHHEHHHDRHDWHRYRGWTAGYYEPPPVVYGYPYPYPYYGPDYYDPYYAPPPVVYGPGVGVNLHFNVR